MRRILAFALAAVLVLALPGCSGADDPSGASSAAPTAEPTPAPLAGDPLTGLEGSGFANARPVAVTLRTGDGSAPYTGLAAADVLVAGVSEGHTAMLTALYPGVDAVPTVGPVGPGRDLTLQMALPLNAIPVHIDKNIYAANLLNLLSYQDLDGYHIGKGAFRFDEGRYAAGTREENCWYTDAALLHAGLDHYGASAAGPSQPLFAFGTRTAPAAQNAADLTVTFDADCVQRLVYDAGAGTYALCAADGTPAADADGTVPAFTNVFVLYASSGIKDDTYTRQYDLSGGVGLYLNAGGWQRIQWTKGDATAPLVLADEAGQPLTVAPGKSYIAIWGGYYGQALSLAGADGAAQTLPEKPALLESGVSDEAAAAAEAAYHDEHAALDAWAALDAAKADLTAAQQYLTEAQATEDTNDDDNAAYLVAAAQQRVEAARDVLRVLGLDPDADRSSQTPAADGGAEAGADSAPAASQPAEPAAP